MHRLVFFFSTVLATQFLYLPVLADVTPLAVQESPEVEGVISGKASLKVIGPLHVSEGIVVMQDNNISVLSDATDPIREAELSGKLIHAHISGEGADRKVNGIAIFTGGYSIKALDGSPGDESITVNDGDIYMGRIVDSNANLLRLKTSSGVKVIPISKISEIKSNRAFVFTLVSAPNNLDASDSPLSTHNQISFSPTFLSDDNTPKLSLHASTLHKQLSENHVKKKLLTAGLVITGAAACVAVPFGMALFTQRPKY
jgi:hypothetical protein